jgi:hypothetical protein
VLWSAKVSSQIAPWDGVPSRVVTAKLLSGNQASSRHTGATHAERRSKSNGALGSASLTGTFSATGAAVEVRSFNLQAQPFGASLSAPALSAPSGLAALSLAGDGDAGGALGLEQARTPRAPRRRFVNGCRTSAKTLAAGPAVKPTGDAELARSSTGAK